VKRISPRQIRRMQSRILSGLGLDVKELGVAEEVLIRLPDKEISIKGANVLELKLEGDKVYQIIGGEVEELERVEVEERYEPSQEDVLLVASQANVSEEEARNALIQAGGDLAKAILLLKARRG